MNNSLTAKLQPLPEMARIFQYPTVEINQIWRQDKQLLEFRPRGLAPTQKFTLQVTLS